MDLTSSCLIRDKIQRTHVNIVLAKNLKAVKKEKKKKRLYMALFRLNKKIQKNGPTKEY